MIVGHFDGMHGCSGNKEAAILHSNFRQAGVTTVLHLSFAITDRYGQPHGSPLRMLQNSIHDRSLLILMALFRGPRVLRCRCFIISLVSRSRVCQCMSCRAMVLAAAAINTCLRFLAVFSESVRICPVRHLLGRTHYRNVHLPHCPCRIRTSVDVGFPAQKCSRMSN